MQGIIYNPNKHNRMRKLLIISLLTILWGIGCVNANPVTPAQARQLATNFAQSMGMQMAKDANDTLVNITSNTPFTELYVFTTASHSGFVIVSADDCVIPILGYSDRNPFPEEDFQEQFVDWMQAYESQIRFHRMNNTQASPQVEEQWAALKQCKQLSKNGTTNSVGPLVSAQWSQGYGYNFYTPIYYNSDGTPKHAPTGCVATALGQIMYYWKWPEHGCGTPSYTWEGINHTSHLADTIFNWDMMFDAPHQSSELAYDVSSLLYNIGIAVHMQYGLTGSGSYTGNQNSTTTHYTAEEALRNHFYYSHTVNCIVKENFTDEEWKATLKAELDANRPMIYAGRTHDGSGGHSFICDGYDADDKFHFNWGWGGSANGFYAVGDLSPEGHNYTFSGYNYAIIGIQPMATIPDEALPTTITAVANNNTFGTVSGSGRYQPSNRVTLYAEANSGYRFKQWSDGNRYNPRYFFPNGGNQVYTAIFEPNTTAGVAKVSNLAASNVTANSATVSWSAPSDATPNGYLVSYGTSSNPLMHDITSTTSTSISLANLNSNTNYHVFVCAQYGNTSSQWEECTFITSNSAITDPVFLTLLCNDESMGFVSGQGVYERGSTVTINATPMPGYAFDNWSDEGDASHTVTLSDDMTLTATFNRIGYTITTSTTGLGQVQVESDLGWTDNGNTYYPYLATICLTALPAEEFQQWSDGNMANPRYITVDGNLTFEAIFHTDSKDIARISSRNGEVEVLMMDEYPIAVYDMLGRQHFYTPAGNRHTHIPIHQSGIYLIKIGNSITKKLVVR